MIIIPVKDKLPNFDETEFGFIVNELSFYEITFSNEGPWIMGGSVLKTLIGMPLGDSDIDIFVGNKFQESVINNKLEKVFKRIKSTTLSISYEMPYTFDDVDKERKIQLITSKIESNPQNIINEFDINICRIVFDGNNFITYQNVLDSITSKTMSVDADFSWNPYFTMMRLIKYSKLGFDVTNSNISDFFKKFFKDEYVKQLESFNSINGGGY